MTLTSRQAIRTQLRTIDGLSIRFSESEEREDHALLLSPWPESLYAFEPSWDRLAERTHLVAIDLPGFGQSERRDSLMAPRAMGEFIVRVADSFGLERPHVVGPDVGTSASLFAAGLFPGRIKSVTVGSGGVAYPLQLGGVLNEWVEAPDLEAYRGIDGREVVKNALGTLERYRPSEAAREDYLASYAGERFVESMRYVRAYPTELPALGNLLSDIQTPVLILQGERDMYVPRPNGEYLLERLPKARLEVIDSGHFFWEDSADAFAALLTRWWDGGYTEA
jgi:pimeloyl-ACP methyl ester carboxylesterase